MGAVRHIRESSNRAISAKLSEQLWNVSWETQLPQALPCGIQVQAISDSDAFGFAAQNFGALFNFEARPSPFLANGDSPAKRRYYDLAADFFGFFFEGELVGMAVCAVTDWSTYNIRHVSVLKEYQGKGIWLEFLAMLAETLRDQGVERLEGDIAPSNFPNMHAVNKFGFMVTGLQLTERWGAMLHVTYFLSEQHQDVFQNQFCHSLHSPPGKR